MNNAREILLEEIDTGTLLALDYSEIDLLVRCLIQKAMDPPSVQDREGELINSSEDEKLAWKSYGDMPSRFKAVLISASSNTSLALEEWNKIASEWRLSEVCYGTSESCICSHKIDNQFFMRNLVTGRLAIVGSDCIKKFGTNSQRWQAEMIDKQRIYSGDKLMCQYCGHMKVATSNSRSIVLCKRCITNGITKPREDYLVIANILDSLSKQKLREESSSSESIENDCSYIRSCSHCKKNINSLPSYYKFCTTCYPKFGKTQIVKTSLPIRCCSKCDGDISSRPPSHTLCLNCYYNKSSVVRSNASRICSDCHYKDISSLERWKSICLNCYHKREKLKNRSLEEQLQYWCGDSMHYPHAEMVKKLLAQGADPTANNDSCLSSAAQSGGHEVVRLLLEDGRIDLTKHVDHEEFGALNYASNNQHLEVVRLLVKNCKWPRWQITIAINCAEASEANDIIELLKNYL